jgi:uncharacterized membrane protein YoaK (UPF0700 family)
VGLGIQNAAVRSIAVPDITTSVLTMTLTGIAADVRARKPRVALRRGLSVATMLVGALVGAVLVLDVNVAAAMWAATAIIALVLLSAFAATKQDAPWQTRAGRAEQTTRPAAGGAMHGSPDARAGAGSVVA